MSVCESEFWPTNGGLIVDLTIKQFTNNKYCFISQWFHNFFPKSYFGKLKMLSNRPFSSEPFSSSLPLGLLKSVEAFSERASTHVIALVCPIRFLSQDPAIS